MLPVERRIVRLAKLGLKVIVPMELHGEICTLQTVVGMPWENALLVKIAYSYIETMLV